MKNKILIVTAVYFAVLLAVPCYTIFNYYDVLKNGEVYKIQVTPYDPYDPFRGRYLAIRPELSALRRPGTYVRLVKDADGFVIDAYPANNAENPNTVKDFELQRYYMNEKTAPLVEALTWDANYIYVAVRVKNARYAVDGLYINGIPAEDYVR